MDKTSFHPDAVCDVSLAARRETGASGALLVLLGALCFSTSGTAQAFAPEGATPYVIGALRMQVAALALFVWCALRSRLPRLAEWPLRWMLPAALGLVAFQICFFKGVQLAGVAVGTVVAIGFSPLVAALLAWAVLDERPAPLWYPSTALALAGLVFLNLGDGDTADWQRLLLPLAAGTGYACYFVFSKPLGVRFAPSSVMLVLCGLSGTLLLPMLLLFPVGWLASAAGAGTALYLGVVTSALAFSLTTAGLARTPAATAATLALAEPLGAACWGIFLLHEDVSLTDGCGIGLLVLGVALLAFARPRTD